MNADDSDSTTNPPSTTRIVLRCIATAILGSSVGIALLFTRWPLSASISIAVLGALIGAALGIPKVSVSNVALAFFTLTLAKNTAGVGKFVQRELIPEKPLEEEIENVDAVSMSLGTWFLQFAFPRCENARSWLMITGVICGVIVGGGLMLHDLHALDAKEEAIFLPLAKSKDPLITQAILCSILIAAWGGAIAGMIASAVYRRTVLITLAISAIVAAPFWLVTLSLPKPDQIAFFPMFLAFGSIGLVLSLSVRFVMEISGCNDLEPTITIGSETPPVEDSPTPERYEQRLEDRPR
ncbi:hypothetical protein [Blastopirellula marina]|uniref:Uncharacterized protein n=1 Tax=Blastopirellula marina TaxID=124 RepID=A0A2S8G6T1_9BACT|nr:hypothetical protein [Blastopirellula marina]PQO40175.1 hypothetical protein C5Y98_06100 [Blastopirellula marina]PTL45542.1 hypothetical protein C5Y97_06100 [Blastopirellula marina]